MTTIVTSGSEVGDGLGDNRVDLLSIAGEHDTSGGTAIYSYTGVYNGFFDDLKVGTVTGDTYSDYTTAYAQLVTYWSQLLGLDGAATGYISTVTQPGGGFISLPNCSGSDTNVDSGTPTSVLFSALGSSGTLGTLYTYGVIDSVPTVAIATVNSDLSLTTILSLANPPLSTLQGIVPQITSLDQLFFSFRAIQGLTYSFFGCGWGEDVLGVITAGINLPGTPYFAYTVLSDPGPPPTPPVDKPVDGGSVPVNPPVVVDTPTLPEPPTGTIIPVWESQSFKLPLPTQTFTTLASRLQRGNITGIINANISQIAWFLSVLADNGTTEYLDLVIDLNGRKLSNLLTTSDADSIVRLP